MLLFYICYRLGVLTERGPLITYCIQFLASPSMSPVFSVVESESQSLDGQVTKLSTVLCTLGIIQKSGQYVSIIFSYLTTPLFGIG